MKEVCKAVGRLLLMSVAIMLLVMGLMPVAMPVSAYNNGIATVSRTIPIQTLSPGETVQITVTITSELDETKAFALKEYIPPSWMMTRQTDDADAFKADTNEWVWFKMDSGVTKIVTYNLTVPVDEAADVYNVFGGVTATGVTVSVHGDSAITVAPNGVTASATGIFYTAVVQIGWHDYGKCKMPVFCSIGAVSWLYNHGLLDEDWHPISILHPVLDEEGAVTWELAYYHGWCEYRMPLEYANMTEPWYQPPLLIVD